MKVFNSRFLLMAVSIFVLYYCSVYYFESNLSASFIDASSIQLFNEFELPSWLMVILGVVVLVNLLKKVSSRLFRIRNYNFMYIALVFLLTSCEDLREGCVTYPSPEDWNDDCGIELYFPYTANYTVRFFAGEDSPSSIWYLPVENANVVCNVIKIQRLPHPSIPDTCYWSQSIDTTLFGTTDSEGYLYRNFPIKFASDADYFILEGSYEKQGYNRELFSRDERYYFYNDQWIPCNDRWFRIPFDRTLRRGKIMTQYNASP